MLGDEIDGLIAKIFFQTTFEWAKQRFCRVLVNHVGKLELVGNKLTHF